MQSHFSSTSEETAEQFLAELDAARPSIELGLDVSKDLLRKLGDPQKKLRVVHVAGTNGKGSTCAMIASALSCSGLRVGVFNSPHLINWWDSILIDGVPDELLWRSSIQTVQQAVGGSAGGKGTITAFEAVCAAMWVQMRACEVDVAVVEVGVGGRLDATNVCEQVEASVICPIGYDHQNLLGSTLAEIASEKAGVLKRGCAAIVTASLDPEARHAIEAAAHRVQCDPITWAQPAEEAGAAQEEGGGARKEKEGGERGGRRIAVGGIECALGLRGEFQLVNAGLAVTTLQTLQRRWSNAPVKTSSEPPRPASEQRGLEEEHAEFTWELSNAHIAEGLQRAVWPGRLEWVHLEGVGRVLLDGAHNPEAAAALRAYVDSLLPPQPVSWVIGMVEGKDVEGLVRALVRRNDSLTAVPVLTLPRRYAHASPQRIADAARAAGASTSTVAPSLTSALLAWADGERGKDGARAQANEGGKEGRVQVVCGSLHLVADFKKLQPTWNGQADR